MWLDTWHASLVMLLPVPCMCWYFTPAVVVQGRATKRVRKGMWIYLLKTAMCCGFHQVVGFKSCLAGWLQDLYIGSWTAAVLLHVYRPIVLRTWACITLVGYVYRLFCFDLTAATLWKIARTRRCKDRLLFCCICCCRCLCCGVSKYSKFIVWITYGVKCTRLWPLRSIHSTGCPI